MKITKGTTLTIVDCRKGTYRAIASDDFDTEADEWYPVVLDQDELSGMSTDWERNEKVPCRRGLSRIEVRGE